MIRSIFDPIKTSIWKISLSLSSASTTTSARTSINWPFQRAVYPISHLNRNKRHCQRSSLLERNKLSFFYCSVFRGDGAATNDRAPILRWTLANRGRIVNYNLQIKVTELSKRIGRLTSQVFVYSLFRSFFVYISIDFASNITWTRGLTKS